ncbi:MAG TPA: hypothetical protein VHT27_01815, partial [Solirubrobacteraceae bacterium]|nr:hypothetical protein [Solirubrobacteraceae bacterium]
MSTVAHRRFTRLGVAAGCCAAALATEAALAPAALALSSGGIVPAGFLGLPSLHGIIEAVAGGFFSALAKALVPSWLTHGTVATIQHLVALPDPAEWPHVRALEAETTYLGAMLAPLTLTVAVLRYWMLGLTGAAHPASAVARCAGATGVLVAYTWIVEQVVAGTNTLTHGLLALGSVSGGLARIIGVLFGGALLTGTGGVFGALLVILGVIFAAGLFATQLLLTVVLAVLIVAGPPLIALAAVPELAHLARAWRDALMTVALIPLGWTVLFATAGALCLDATSFTGGGGGLPGHIAAAFAGLITFALAVKLPLVLLDELRHVLSRASLTGASSSAAATSTLPGTERVRSAHARLRAIGLAGAPAIGASIGAAAGALGAPAGGPLGAARRRLSNAGNRPGGRASADSATPGRAVRRGIGERIVQARAILARAPQQAARAVREATPQTPTGRSRFERTRRAPGAQQNRERPGGGPSGAAGERPQAQQGTAPRRAASSSRPKS